MLCWKLYKLKKVVEDSLDIDDNIKYKIAYIIDPSFTKTEIISQVSKIIRRPPVFENHFIDVWVMRNDINERDCEYFYLEISYSYETNLYSVVHIQIPLSLRRQHICTEIFNILENESKQRKANFGVLYVCTDEMRSLVSKRKFTEDDGDSYFIIF